MNDKVTPNPRLGSSGSPNEASPGDVPLTDLVDITNQEAVLTELGIVPRWKEDAKK